jgi:hypothetical protein
MQRTRYPVPRTFAPSISEYLERKCGVRIGSVSETEDVGNRGVGNLRRIGLAGLGPASQYLPPPTSVDSLLIATTNISMPPYEVTSTGVVGVLA